MGYKLCTAEKRSVALDIANVVGATKPENGYFVGNGYIVTWAVGHLVGLAEPDLYGYVSKADIWNNDKEIRKERREKAYNELPLLPRQFKTTVIEDTKKQFEIMKTLMHRDDVDYIIDCGDMGAEGHILQWLIREKAENTKPVKRFCATSMTKEAIKHSMEHLRNIDDFKLIIIGEYCKKKADWELGMSVSRCASIKYDANINAGRVLSPLLYFVVKRYFEVSNFKVTDYYQLQANFVEGFSCMFLKDMNNNFSTTDYDLKNRLVNKTKVQDIASQLKAFKYGTVSALETNNKATERPQLYDSLELQSDGNRIYGYTASQVLDTTQCLYEKFKVLTYPRTDSRYITSDLAPYMQDRLSQISGIDKYKDITHKVINTGLRIDNLIVDDSKVTDHHAIIVTENIKDFDLSTLIPTKEDAAKGVTAESLQNVLHLVITRMLVSFSQRYTYKETFLCVTFPNKMIFGAKGILPVNMGWKDIHKNLMGNLSEQDSDAKNKKNGEAVSDTQLFQNVSLGKTVHIDDVLVLAKKTTPPLLHTDASLLAAMKNAGSQCNDKGKIILRGKGIGTQATRAGIIKELFDKGYVKYKKIGKTNYIIPEEFGINIIKILPSDLYSPQITADWELKIADITNGTYSAQQFMDDFTVFLNNKIAEIKSSDKKEVDFTKKKEIIGSCPFCGNIVYDGVHVNKELHNKITHIAYCSNKDCKFSLSEDNHLFTKMTKKNITAEQLKKLVAGDNLTLTCYNRNDMPYKCHLSLAKTPNEQGYVHFEFEFVKSRSKHKKST